ncbi:hypothetical protein D3C76_1564670 [compost metagenome]
MYEVPFRERAADLPVTRIKRMSRAPAAQASSNFASRVAPFAVPLVLTILPKIVAVCGVTRTGCMIGPSVAVPRNRMESVEAGVGSSLKARLESLNCVKWPGKDAYSFWKSAIV